MVKSRKELRIYITSSILASLVVSMTFTTFLSSTSFSPGIELGATNSFIRLASASSDEGGGESIVSGGGDGGGDGGGGGDQGGSSETEPEPEEDGTVIQNQKRILIQNQKRMFSPKQADTV